MKILLSGASGLVGRNILEAAPRGVHEMLTPTHAELDLLDQAAVLEYIRREKPDMVIHAAGVVGGIAANKREPHRFLLENLDMGRNLIDSAFQAGVKKFINLGASCMYPRNRETPLTEDMLLTGELEPTNEGYALAKIVCARLCSYINRENPDCRYKTLIPCNLYGRWDKFTGENAHLIPAAIHKVYQAVKSGANEVEIWGSGNARREFMYAGDLADCIWHAVENFDHLPDMMNVGLGFDHTVNEYYEAIFFASSKAAALGWRQKTSLDDGIRLSYEDYIHRVLGAEVNEKPAPSVASIQGNKIGIGWAYVSDVGKKYVNAALDAGRLSQGDMVHRFEKEFARLHDQKYGIALNSGTGALHVGLEAMKEKFHWSNRTSFTRHTHTRGV